MKHHLMAALAAASMAAWACAAAAGEILPGSPKAALAAELIARDQDGWRLYKEKDAEGLMAMTSEDFRDLYSDGEVVGRERWLADMRGVDVERSETWDFHAFDLSDDAVLLAYKGEAWGRSGGQQVHNKAAVTSVWARRGGKWLNVFYGETALTPDSVFSGAKKP
jgi:hypothetical protein